MTEMQSALAVGLESGIVALVAIWLARRFTTATVPVVLVEGIDGRTREFPLDELERRLNPDT